MKSLVNLVRRSSFKDCVRSEWRIELTKQKVIQAAFRGGKQKKGGDVVESTSTDILNIYKDKTDPVGNP